MSDKYRLVTRSDFDGLVCAVLLKELDLIDDIVFVHPKDMQDGLVEISGRDITTNLPYVSEAHMAFDHHHSETIRNQGTADNHIIDGDAPSAARVVYDYYGGAERFPTVSTEMMDAVDKADSAMYELNDIIYPERWALLNFVMDARTGLGRFRDFRISNYQLMMELIEHCRTASINEILELPDVKERTELYMEHDAPFKEQIKRCATQVGKVVILDLRSEDVIFAGNRFMIYALYPDAEVSVHVLWGKQKQNTVFAVGKSIINRDSHHNIGELMLEYGGGGHRKAGTCQVSHEDAERVLGEIVDRLQ
ncbi:MAG: exopolyphosphatase [Acidimicrobiia bacterium]|nr:exopolyphosphatase [Acidimicrobiia bacterium]MBT8217152.1 exopolyphosphatase [Acidimicrobiia bacterium]NNF11166.1 exopolyphosphatase [Acidimicrobiia bacterium]NNL69330.1 exopolyphosphatase [Acidimicrobiia bacterium]